MYNAIRAEQSAINYQPSIININMDENKAIDVGNELKLSVRLTELGEDYTMDDVDFVCKFYTSRSHIVEVAKEDMMRNDANEYIAMVDTYGMASGSLKMLVCADIIDADFEGGIRHESDTVDTGITLINNTVRCEHQ